MFFAGASLKDQTDKWVSRKFVPYMFMGGSEFSDMKVYKDAGKPLYPPKTLPHGRAQYFPK